MSSTFELPTFSVSHADDIMEVSSEHGHNAGDEDIDIDIDLPGGHVDEDDVFLDDASNNGSEDNFLPQPSPATVNDELMIDNADEEYYLTQDLILGDGNDGMDRETLPMSFDQPSNSEFRDVQHIGGVQEEPADTEFGDHQDTDISNIAEMPKTDQDLVGENHEGTEQTSTENDEIAADSKTIDDLDGPVEGTPKADLHKSSRPASPHTIAVTVTSPPNSPSATTAAPIVETSNHPVSNIDSYNPDGSQGPSDAALVDRKESLSSREIVVLYQDSEYALFSTSESDDINSYFLSDFSIMEKSIDSLFGAIRTVIHEDISDEEQLCIFVNELDLELMENHVSAENTTLGQIMELHSKLLRNDGVETPQSLHLSLETKKNFSVRFDNLTKSAAEGKGLSEVVRGDDVSEGLDGLEELEGHQKGDDPTARTQSHEVTEESVQEEKRDAAESSEANHLSGDTSGLSLDQGQAEESNNTHGLETTDLSGNTSNIAKTQQTGAESVPNLENGEALVHSTEHPNGEGEYAEDDLIDYSDEETEALTRVEDGVDYDDEHQAEEESSYLDVQQEEPSVDDVIPYPQDEEDESGHFSADDLNGYDITNAEWEGDGSHPEPQTGEETYEDSIDVEKGIEIFDEEFEFGEENDLTQAEDHPGPLTTDPSTERDPLSGDFQYPLEDYAEATQSHANLEKSESVGSDKTLEAQPSLEVEQEDEINYDDDEEEAATAEVQSTALEGESISTPQAGLGKRSRAEELSDDGIDTRGKDAKRPRS